MMWCNAGSFKSGEARTVRSTTAPASEGPASDDTVADQCDPATDQIFVTDDRFRAGETTVEQVDITRRIKEFGVPVSPQNASDTTFVTHPGTRDVTAVQQLWQEHARAAADLYPKTVWKVLHAVKHEAKQTQSNVLRACAHLLSPVERRNWPTTRRQVDAKIARLGSFHHRVTRRVLVDLSHHKISGTHDLVTCTHLQICYPRLSTVYPLLIFMYPSVTLIYPPVNICYPRLNTVYPLLIFMYPSVTLIHPSVNICYPRRSTLYPLLMFRSDYDQFRNVLPYVVITIPSFTSSKYQV